MSTGWLGGETSQCSRDQAVPDVRFGWRVGDGPIQVEHPRLFQGQLIATLASAHSVVDLGEGPLSASSGAVPRLGQLTH